VSEMNDETEPAYVICVQSAVGDMETDWFWLEPGEEPVIASFSSRELNITKIPAGASDDEDEEFVALYGTDMWVRVWIAEYDPDAEPDEDEETEE
jgi:hypothetical protein